MLPVEDPLTNKVSNIEVLSQGENPCGIMAKVRDCSLKIREFKLQLCYYIHFWTSTLGKGMNPQLPTAFG